MGLSAIEKEFGCFQILDLSSVLVTLLSVIPRKTWLGSPFDFLFKQIE